MTGKSIPTLISVDPSRPAHEQKGIHNRWHPELKPVATVAPGDIFKLESHEWTGGQVHNDDSADDLYNVDLTRIHYLTGPVDVEGTEPGDVLVVDILDVQPFESHPWGFTGIFEKNNGGGLFATEFDSKATKAIWDFKGIYATSRHIPGVRFAGCTHPGLIGTRPSKELLTEWNRREGELIHNCKVDGVDPVPAVAFPPEPKGAYAGQDLPDDVRKRFETEGARTVPGREHGGNVDIKNLSRGSRCYFPVFTKGAGLSFGDLHFSQGDGEMSFCGAIEMAGIITLQVGVIKGGVEKFAMTMPIFLPSPVDPQYSSRIIFEGIGVDLANKKQGNMDATMAYKMAALNCIAYLAKLGYTREQAYLLLSACPIDSSVASLVDSPNAVVTLSLPTAIFDRDILPQEEGLEKRDYGNAALRSDGVRGIYE